MVTRFRLFALGALAAILTAGAPALAQTTIENPPDPYVHKAAGVAFPAELGPFRRGRVVEFNEQGNDASIGYAPTEARGDISLYLYPNRGASCRDEFEGAGEAILKRGGTPIAETAGLSHPALAGSTELSRVYTIEPNGYGFTHPRLVSYLYVACLPGRQWLVKYRGSFVVDDSARALAQYRQLFRAIDWSPLIRNP